jgi:hypothetical protein
MEPEQPPRVYYDEGSDLRHGFLVYRGATPFLVISFRSENEHRVPHVFYELEPEKLQQVDFQGSIFRYRGKLLQPH